MHAYRHAGLSKHDYIQMNTIYMHARASESLHACMYMHVFKYSHAYYACTRVNMHVLAHKNTHLIYT